MSGIDRPFHAGIDGDAGGSRGLIELHRIDTVRQLDPQEDAARRIVEFRRGPRAELLGQRLHQRLELIRSPRRSFGT